MRRIEDLGMQYPTKDSRRKARYGIYKCPECNQLFKTMTDHVKSGATTKCKSCAIRIKNRSHRMSQTKLYTVWTNMKQRCLEEKNPRYAAYGGRGISICEEWVSSSGLFFEWALSNGYTDKLTLDRIDNNGNYEPSNCRFVTRETQAANTRKIRSNNTSGYRGVCKSGKKWSSQITHNNKRNYLGTFAEAKEAAEAYDEYIIKNELPHTRNFNEKEKTYA